MRYRISASLILLLLGGVFAEVSLGCRFNVRETGFVDLGFERYFLFCYTGVDTPEGVVSKLEEHAREILRDSRVEFGIVPSNVHEGHPALKYIESANGVSFPALVMVSPKESVRIIGSLESLEEDLPSALREVVSSPLRERIVESVSSSYGAVLLIEGEDGNANAKVRKAAELAIGEIEKQLPFLPKPIERGPVLLTLPNKSLARERTLLWSLGVVEEPFPEPRIAVLYGRTRLIGPLLKGDEITEQSVYGILSIVGADCECGIDPTLLRGTGLPVRWGRDVQAVVAKELGFDPENPMVKTEVSQILHMQSALYPWNVTARERRERAVDDLPVPFVEDTDPPGERDAGKGSAWMSSLLAMAGMAGVVLLVAVFLFVRAVRRGS